MASTKQASELATSDEAYEKIFRETPPAKPVSITDLPLDLLDSFSTADIGFRPYPLQQLQAFAEQLQEEGLMVRIIVRPKENGRYEILAGHNRVATRLAGWTTIASEVVEADDVRAIASWRISSTTRQIRLSDITTFRRMRTSTCWRCAGKRKGSLNCTSGARTAGRSKQFALTSCGVWKRPSERERASLLCAETLDGTGGRP